jgi:hypothetical protein
MKNGEAALALLTKNGSGGGNSREQIVSRFCFFVYAQNAVHFYLGEIAMLPRNQISEDFRELRTQSAVVPYWDFVQCRKLSRQNNRQDSNGGLC